MVLLTGSAHPLFAEQMAQALRLTLGKAHCHAFADGELDIWVEERVSGEDVVIIQSTVPPANTAIMELCLLADAVRREGARSIMAVTPYFGYARKERQSRAGEPVSAKVVVDNFVASGVTRIMGCDLHAPAIAGFSTVPFNIATPLSVFAEILRPSVSPSTIVLAPDVGGVKRARDFASLLGSPIGFIEKQRRPDGRDQTETLSLNGVNGQGHAIIIDDLLSTGSTVRQAASYLKDRGVSRVDVVVTHMLGYELAWQALQDSAIDRIFIGDTVPNIIPGYITKAQVVPLAPFMANFLLTTI